MIYTLWEACRLVNGFVLFGCVPIQTCNVEGGGSQQSLVLDCVGLSGRRHAEAIKALLQLLQARGTWRCFLPLTGAWNTFTVDHRMATLCPCWSFTIPWSPWSFTVLLKLESHKAWRKSMKSHSAWTPGFDRFKLLLMVWSCQPYLWVVMGRQQLHQILGKDNQPGHLGVWYTLSTLLKAIQPLSSAKKCAEPTCDLHINLKRWQVSKWWNCSGGDSGAQSFCRSGFFRQLFWRTDGWDYCWEKAW